jgi:hypothetical protein
MTHEEPAAHDASAQDTAVQAQETAAYEPIEEDEGWLEEPEELPRRPRRRLLSPIPIALLAALLTACGFIGGVLVEKGQTSSSSSAGASSGLASRLAGLRAGGAGASASGVTASGGSAGGGGGSGATRGGQRPTAGQVAYINGGTLYVTNAEGNTVKVTTSAGTSVNKTVKGSINAIHPGETVTVTGASGASGAISAESINVGSGAGGFGSLLGGLGTRSGSGSGTGGGTGGGGEQALFGKGG